MITGMPALISTEWTITGGGPDAFPTNTFELQNPFDRGVLVRELHFANATRIAAPFIAHGVYLRFELRGKPITKDFVRARLMMPRPDGDGDVLIAFSHPIYVAPNDVVSFWARSPTDDLAGLASLRGTFVDPLPPGSKILLPYFADYEPPAVTLGSTSRIKSTPVDLRNPFRAPMWVDHMIGYRHSRTLSHATIYNNPPINLKVRSHDGTPIVRDLIPFYDLFHTRDRVWEIKQHLPAGGHYIVTAEVDATTALQDSDVEFGIGMVGYREERL